MAFGGGRGACICVWVSRRWYEKSFCFLIKKKKIPRQCCRCLCLLVRLLVQRTKTHSADEGERETRTRQGSMKSNRSSTWKWNRTRNKQILNRIPGTNDENITMKKRKNELNYIFFCLSFHQSKISNENPL